MPDHHQLPAEEITRPLVTEVHIHVVPVLEGQLPGYRVIAGRQTWNGRECIEKKLVVEGFFHPSHSNEKKRYDANAHAVALSEIFGVMNVKLA